MHGNFKLGCVKRSPLAPKVHLTTFLTAFVKLPEPPVAWSASYTSRYGLYKNDTYGNCGVAGIANISSQQLASEDLGVISYEDDEVVDYYLIYGNGKDQGVVLYEFLKYVRRNGFPRDRGYQLQGFAEIQPDHVSMLKSACATFNGLYVGVELPLTAKTQNIWEVGQGAEAVPGSWGRHCVVWSAFNTFGPLLVTWGRTIQASWEWWLKYGVEAWALFDKQRGRQAGVDMGLLSSYLDGLV